MENKHLESIIGRMGRRDREIANQLAEAGFSDEDLYAALPNPGVDKLLGVKAKPQPKRAARKAKKWKHPTPPKA